MGVDSIIPDFLFDFVSHYVMYTYGLSHQSSMYLFSVSTTSLRL